ncbi:hypothetical protein EVAR_1020_1 [Eumeta japonica]|uniref:Uncharacterized protein n=1 Tax=Eumeta variegata TaxID=151549 RepID=A0A4C1SE82_EUMVA|nr:hypothetical protein EVAR_1020_1 [Eumeta japonica]
MEQNVGNLLKKWDIPEETIDRFEKLIINDVKFLQARDEIKYMNWDDIIQKWNNTFQYRQDQEYASVQEFITKWPVLEDERAIELINIDFQFLYPHSPINETNFNVKWNLFFNKFLLAKKYEINDEFKENLLSSLNSLHSEDQKIPTQITLMAHLVPPKGRFNRKGKFSTLEALQSLVIVVENPGDINIKIKEKQKAAAERKQSVQPYIIIQGSLQDYQYLYIVVDDIKYKFTSAAEAFDTLFKIYHVFNARYPSPADHLYLIIQRCVYDVTTKYDNLVPYIADVLALKQMD